MRKKKLFWQLFPTYLLVIVLSLLGAVWYASVSLRQFHLQKVKEDLEARAHLLSEQISVSLTSENYVELDRLCKKLGLESGTRITVVLPDGMVVADSEENPAKMGNHADRSEVAEALTREMGVSTRYSDTLKKSMMYVAIPVRKNERIHGVVRTSVPLASIGKALYPVYMEIVIVAAVIGLAAIVLGTAVARRISRPLEEIKRGAERFADGDLTARLPIPATDEIGSLAETMNRMASQLSQRIHAITQQSSEQQAILSSMVEGVLAVDKDENIIRMNLAAAEMLNMPPEDVEGKSVRETLSNPVLKAFISRALCAAEPIEEDNVLDDIAPRFLHLRGAVLKDSDNRATGAVVVLNDITKLKNLENMRREFVANVSHELKTPITSVKGFVETLQDGALEDKEDARRFLDIIANELDRLNSIIEDLLLLSRVEQDTEKSQIHLEQTSIRGILENAIQARAPQAQEKRIVIDLNCDESLNASVNELLLEHAIVNLVDNAIKYSDEGNNIEIECLQRDGEISISVTDHGCGIESRHLSRVFERFYRVDRARSRKLGGTGLGLAIVKHIVQAHGGYVNVSSTPGKSSTFSISLPKA